MKERTAEIRRTEIERFRAYAIDSCTTLHFEQTGDLALAIRGLSGVGLTNSAEEQILVRYNVDDEGLAIVYVDGACGPDDDVSALDAAIAVLQDTRDRLAALQAAGA